MIELLSLFPFFPRRIGIPKRTGLISVEISSEKYFFKYYQLYRFSPNGFHVSVYDSTKYPVIDKILFEFDGKDLNEVFEEVKHFINQIQGKFEYVVFFSGKKGFHVYILLKPEELPLETAKLMLKQFVSQYLSDFKFLDSTKTGVVGCLIRVPNTRNGNRFCVPLPNDFVDWQTHEILQWSKEPKRLRISFPSDLPSLSELTDLSSSVANFNLESNGKLIEINYLPSFDLLKPLLRPCTFYEIQTSNPPHIVRFNFVAELLQLGLSPKSIHKIIKEQLNWSDYDEEKTAYYINYIYQRKLLPYGCRKTSCVVNCSKYCSRR